MAAFIHQTALFHRPWRFWAKYTVFLLGLITLVLLSILSARTLGFQSQQVAAKVVFEKIPDEARAIQRFAGSLRFQTIASPSEYDPTEFARLHSYLAQEYPRVHESLSWETVGSSLLYHWRGSDTEASPVLLMSHLDVVPVPRSEVSKWSHAPWSGKIAGGYVWGRGALDVKCGVCGVLEAVEILLENGFTPACDVYFAFGHDEEIGGQNGNGQIAMLLRGRDVQFRFVLDEGGAIATGMMPGLKQPLALIAVAEKGFATIRLTAAGMGGHSSMPPAETAVSVLSNAIVTLQQTPRTASLSGPVGLMLDAVGPETELPLRAVLANRDLLEPLLIRQFSQSPSLNALIRSTAATTVVRGGEQPNVLPAEAYALVNFRLLPGDSPEAVLRFVEDVVKDPNIICTIESGAVSPSHVSDPQSTDYRIIARSVREVTPDIVAAPGLSIVGTDSRHYEGLTKNTFRFLPLRLTEADFQRIHGIDERLSQENYLEVVRFFLRLFKNL